MKQNEKGVGQDEEHGQIEAFQPPGALECSHTAVPHADNSLLTTCMSDELRPEGAGCYKEMCICSLFIITMTAFEVFLTVLTTVLILIIKLMQFKL